MFSEMLEHIRSNNLPADDLYFRHFIDLVSYFKDHQATAVDATELRSLLDTHKLEQCWFTFRNEYQRNLEVIFNNIEDGRGDFAAFMNELQHTHDATTRLLLESAPQLARNFSSGSSSLATPVAPVPMTTVDEECLNIKSPVLMKRALLILACAKSLPLRDPNTNQLIVQLEAELMDHTKIFLQNEFELLTKQMPLNRQASYSSLEPNLDLSASVLPGQVEALRQMMDQEKKEQIEARTISVFTVDGMSVSKLYKENIQRAQNTYGLAAQQNMGASIFLGAVTSATEGRYAQIDNRYLSLEFESSYFLQLNSIVKKQKVATPYLRLNELISINDTAEKMTFTAIETKNFYENYIKQYADKTKCTSIQKTAFLVTNFLPRLTEFFRFSPTDFMDLVDQDANIPHLLTNKISTRACDDIIDGLSEIIIHFDKMNKILINMLKVAHTDNDKAVITDYQERLTYQFTRPTRLLLILKEIQQCYDNIEITDDNRALEWSLPNFNSTVRTLEIKNLVINATQAALDYKTQIDILLNAPAPTSLFSRTKEQPFKFLLESIKKIFEKHLTLKRQNPERLIDFDAMLSEINRAIALAQANRKEPLTNNDTKECKLILDIAAYYQTQSAKMIAAQHAANLTKLGSQSPPI